MSFHGPERLTNEQIGKILSPLIVAFTFSDEMAGLYDEKLRGLSDFEAAMRTTDALIDDVESLRAPAWSVFKKTYDRWHARFAEQRAEHALALTEGQGRLNMVTPKEGRQIAAAAYAKQYKRSPPANIFELPDPDYIAPATEEEIETATAAIKSGYEHDGLIFSCYDDVLRAFDGHQRTARAACRALEQSRRIIHRTDGVIVWVHAA